LDRHDGWGQVWGRFVARHRWVFVGVWLLAVIVLGLFATGTPRALSPTGFETDTEASRTTDVLAQQFPERRAPVITVVFQSRGTPVSDPAYQRQVRAWRQDVDRLVQGRPGVVVVQAPGRDGRTTALLVESNRNSAGYVELGGRVEAIEHPGPAHAYVGGFATVYNDFVVDSERGLEASERISLPIALVLLLLVFGGLVAGLLPVLTGLATVSVAVALLGFVARAHDVSVFSLNVSSILGIGLGIDYSLLVVNRFREELRRPSSVEDAVAATVGSAGVATLVSGGTVAIGFGALMLSRLNVVWSMGLGGALVVLVSMLASLTLIPALLAVFGGSIDRLALPFTRRHGTAAFWHGLATRVMRRPLVYMALVLAVVGVLLWPARQLQMGIEGAESLPPGANAVTAQRLAEEQLGFPPHAPTLVVLHPVPDLATAGRLEQRLRASAAGQPVRGAPDVPGPLQSQYLHGGYAVYELEQPAGDNDPATRSWLDRIRATSWPAGVTAQIGGEAAAYQDFLAALLGDFPLILGTVLVCTLGLLGLAFRSVLLPLKAVAMNLLSVGAAMGVLTWGFQEGHLARLLDFQPVGFVDATIPIVIFAALFGISMDYEVFLLSRIREEWRAGHSNADAVAIGMERTGQIITSAALILVAVSSTLALSQLTIDKGLGVSFAVAIFLDATLIRLLLVPAFMRVVGDANWWPARRPPR
jgi:trehalose monomycolate/heme transporter